MFINAIIVGLVLVTTFVVVTGIFLMVVGVPSVPTPLHIADAMIDMVPWKGREHVVDLGAGDGRLLGRIKQRHPDVSVDGCEIVPTIWLMGRLRSMIKRDGVRVRLQSFRAMNIKDADVIFLYLFPGIMKELQERFDRELSPGTYVVTHTFGFHGRKALKEIRVPRLGGEVSVWLYQW